ncbi:MAG: DUF4331 domain-containing protein, partial [Ilumatobacter sp.]|uniref:DUF4331 domain-containing protein n=1 Tax=Ilumatobacter sp. TaxID=1967498 RepID=UPI003C74969E
RGAAAGAGFALVATLVATTTGPASLSASSHREAPLIAGDPRADNTDVYAFVSPDDEDSVTIIANWLPFSEPNGGPNFYPWADGEIAGLTDDNNGDDGYNLGNDDTAGQDSGAVYKVNIDNDGDAVADIVYSWVFDTITKDPGQFLVNTGQFDSVNDDTLNVYQTYDLIVTDVDAGTDTTVLDDAIAAPSISGAVSTPDYQPLVDEAVASGTAGDLTSFAGQADDPFFLDLRVFDLLYGGGVVPEVGEDTLAGYNVNTIALQVPKSELALNDDATNNPVVGIWSTTDRFVRTDDGGTDDPSDDDYEAVQVSRLGNPLVNEVVIPLAIKDAFNSIPPSADADVAPAVDAVQFPILPPLVQAIYGLPVPGDDDGDNEQDNPRTDLVEIFLQGVSVENTGLAADGDENPALAADLNSLGLNADVDASTIRPSEMLRLNMAVPVAAEPSDAGVLGGDFQGFPNGRRLEDDVVDIALAVVEGAVYQGGSDVSGLAPFDSVDRNDRDFKDVFPYVANPHLDSVNNGSTPPDNTPRNPSIISINPERILDTRDSDQAAAGSTTVVNLGDALVPEDAQAAFLNITAARAGASGFVTAFPCDADGDGTQDDRPVASSLNPDPARIVSGLVSAVPDAEGNVCIYTETATDLIVDVQAYIPGSAVYTAIQPERLLDTRNGTKPGAASTQTIDVSDVDGVAGPDGSKAVLVNITSAQTDSDGFITAYPCDADLPNTSNLNTRTGTRRANLASVKVSADDTICVYSSDPTHIAVDIVGAFPAASAYTPIVPERLVDTRNSTGYTGAKPIAGQIIEIDVRGPGTNVPDDSGTVVLNVTGVAPEGDPGYLTVFPCGEDVPTASNLNLQDLNTAAAAVAKVGDNDRVCVYTFQPAHVIVDLVGFFPGTVLPS